MELLNTFGINPVLMLAQIVNFLILFFVLKRFFYKPVLKNLAERKRMIEKGIEDAKKGEELLEEAKRKEQKLLKDAANEVQRMLQEARIDAEQIRSANLERLKIEQEKMLAEGKQQIELERKRTEQELMQKIVIIATDIVEKTLKNLLRTEDRKKIEEKVEKEIFKSFPDNL